MARWPARVRPAERHARRRRRERSAAPGGVHVGRPHDAGGAAGVPRLDDATTARKRAARAGRRCRSSPRSGTNGFDGSGYWFMRRTDDLERTSTSSSWRRCSPDEPSEPPKLDKDIWRRRGRRSDPAQQDVLLRQLREARGEQRVAGRARACRRDRSGTACSSTSARWRRPARAAPSQGFTGSHHDRVGLVRPDAGPDRDARSARDRPEPRGVAVLQAVPVAERARPGRQEHHGLPVRRADQERLQDVHRRASTTGCVDNRSIFGRVNIQDDTTNAAPQFPGQDRATPDACSTTRGSPIGYDDALGPTWSTASATA